MNKITINKGLPITTQEEQDSFSLVIRNNTNSTVEANILGAITNLKDNANSKISYSYNLAGETYLTTSISIQFRSVNQPSFQTVNLSLPAQNIEGVVFALNQLGIGTWYYSGTNVITYNDDYVFGDLTVTAVYAGLLDTSFIYGTGFDAEVLELKLQNDGKIVCVGAFTNYNGTSANRIIRLNTDGSVDSSFLYGIAFNSIVRSLEIQSDGKIICVGQFTNYNGIPANGIIRLNTDGTYDNTFVYGTGFFPPASSVNTINLQTNGKFIVTGTYASYNGNFNPNILRLNSNGTFDNTFVSIGFNTFNPNSDLAIQNDGKYVVVGLFTLYGLNVSSHIIRINTDGSYDNTLSVGTGFNNPPLSVAIQNDGKIIAGGLFTSYNGIGANGIVRLNTNGTIDGTFFYGSGFDDDVQTIFVQSDGKILIGGKFNVYNGTPANGIIRLNTDGSVDNTFNSGTGFSILAPASIGLQIDNKYVIGGYFIQYDGISANRIVRLYN